MQTLRAALVLIGFLGLTLPLMPVQYVLVKAKSKYARTLPHWFHRRVARMLGIRIHVHGSVVRDRPVLIVSNHISWLDIIVLSSIAPVSFIAKSEIDGWPMINAFARLQRTLFVNRNRRSEVKGKTQEIAARLAAGDSLVLFAEGTSSDGNRVLPFKSSLFAALGNGADGSETGLVQTATLVYTHMHGLPLNRNQKPAIAWYGDMDMLSHGWAFLRSGPIDVKVIISEPVSMSRFGDRKQLSAFTERSVRSNFAAIMTARRPAPVMLSHQPGNEDHASQAGSR